MSDEWSCWFIFSFALFLISGQIVAGSTPDTDREVLLQLKSFLMSENKIIQGQYIHWNQNIVNQCEWQEITCTNGRVTGLNLSDNQISGPLFRNFSALTELTVLDLSSNTIKGVIPADLNGCSKLRYLNMSRNLIEGELNLTGLHSIEVLDLTSNRLIGEIQSNFPAICDKLVTLNISSNNFTGQLDNCFDKCSALQYLDLSSNDFTGNLWLGFPRLRGFSVSENNLTGELLPSIFTRGGCSLENLDLSENHFYGKVPGEISNCRDLVFLVLWGNNFTDLIPTEIGLLNNLTVLVLGSNKFFREVPESILNCSKLSFLDISKNGFRGDVQEIFGRLVQVKFLVLHGNSYTGGIISSGILQLPNVSRLDLSYNNFSGTLPIEISNMPSLKFLILAYNNFTGSIPNEFGNLSGLQALDLSYNKLTGAIPVTLGKINSLLWLMLANNSLSGEIPPEIGNCGSLLWLNLANNHLSGKMPPELSNIGQNVTPTFELNRRNNEVVGSGECLTMKRWLPADYPPFRFVYTLLTRKSCKSLWEVLLKGHGLFSICNAGSAVRILHMSGYLQLSGNQLSGEVPPEIGKMQNLSLIHLGMNNFSGKFPPEIQNVPLVVLNISFNKFSGEIPSVLGKVKCLLNLDLSSNNFSGDFPVSLSNLNDLNRFNVSFNPLLSGVVPNTGQLATFERDSFLGDPLLFVPSLQNNSDKGFLQKSKPGQKTRKPTTLVAFFVFLVLTLFFLVCGLLSFIVCFYAKQPRNPPEFLLEDSKYRHDIASSSCGSSPHLSDSIKIVRLDKTAFTYADILKATANFSEERIVGRGGFGIVYRGTLPDEREVAVKKLQREGAEGEREFHAEMQVLCSTDIGWPHPNLVPLYGWCLYGSERLLVYEYMEGGSLDELLTDRTRLTWRRRIEVAIGVARALLFLHHECFPAIVHRDVKGSNVLLDREGTAHVTDFGLARVVSAGDSHVSTIVAGTIGYVAPEYGHTWKATTKGDVYSFGILAMELATARRAVDGGEECLLEWARRVIGDGRQGLSRAVPVLVLGLGLTEGAEEMSELLKIGLRCAADSPHARPNMKEVLLRLVKIYNTSMKIDPSSKSKFT